MPDRRETPPDRKGGRAWSVLVIAAASAYSPLTVLANAGEMPVLPTLVMAFGLIFAAGLTMWALMRSLGLQGEGSAYAVVLIVLFMSNTGGFVGDFHRWDRLGLMVVAFLLGAIGYRLRDLGSFRAVMTWLVLFVLAYPGVNLFSRAMAVDDVKVDAGTYLGDAEMAGKPDVILVVFDAYGGRSVLQEFYGFDNSAVLDRLASVGFQAPGEITANYSRTQLSIPSVMQLGYVAEEGDITQADIDALQMIVNGESRLAEQLRSQGYRTVYVESGWTGSRCSPSIHVCIKAPWPDETFFDVAYRSLLLGMPGFELGRSFTEGALAASEWLEHELRGYLNDETPDYIFAHVLLPHPPLFLDEHCDPDWRDGQSGFFLGRIWFADAQVEAARWRYLKQVECVNSIVLRIADQLGPDDVAILMGDHGPDSLGQLFVPGTEWTEAQRRERYTAFFAARAPGCDMANIESLVNVGRRLMSCLTTTDLPDLPTRIYDWDRVPGATTVHQLELPNGETQNMRTSVRSEPVLHWRNSNHQAVNCPPTPFRSGAHASTI